MTQRAFEIDTRQVEALADGLALISGARLGAMAVDTVNEVAVRTEAKMRTAIAAGINLSNAYIEGRLGVRPATDASRAEAVIYSPFSATPLGRYDPQQLTVAVKHPDRAKGDSARGIPKGLKAAGIAVEVTRGPHKTIEHGFTMPLRNGNGIGVFTRDPGSKNYRHRYGPAVYQLARVATDRLADEIGVDLELTLAAEADRLFDEVFQ